MIYHINAFITIVRAFQTYLNIMAIVTTYLPLLELKRTTVKKGLIK